MKRTALALIIALLFSAVAGTQLVNLGRANPSPYLGDAVEVGEMQAPEGSAPLIISILSPKNNTIFNSNNISLIFELVMPESIDLYWLPEVYYKASWQSGRMYMNYGNIINLTNVSEGSHSIEVAAVAKYIGYTTRQEIQGIHLTTYYVSYRMNSSSSVNFSVDLPPKASIVSPENKTYSTFDVPLNFTVNESVSQCTYTLDQGNVTATGNTTLTGLPVGEHNITVFVTDEVGNTGASETIFFTIEDSPELFPTPMVIAPIASVAFVGTGLLVYFKKRKG